METTVVTCQVDRMVGCGTYEHTFDFPEEWETEKRILLIGIWISDTSERMGSFDFWYYNLRSMWITEMRLLWMRETPTSCRSFPFGHRQSKRRGRQIIFC